MQKIFPIIALSSIFLFSFCKKKEENKTIEPSAPSIGSAEISNVKYTKASCYVEISNWGGVETVEQGIILSINNNKIDEGDSVIKCRNISSSFTIELSSLIDGQKYYVFSFAENVIGKSYGAVTEFETDPIPKTVTDFEGNIYNTVRIGDQVWTVENLKVSRYNNGDLINELESDYLWEYCNSTGGYCYLNNDEENNELYGKLYNYYTLIDSRGICPDGWRLPKVEDFNTLVETVDYQGKTLKSDEEYLWGEYYGTNKYGFSARPSGYRLFFGYFLERSACYWLNESIDNTAALFYINEEHEIDPTYSGKNHGASIRLILEE